MKSSLTHTLTHFVSFWIDSLLPAIRQFAVGLSKTVDDLYQLGGVLVARVEGVVTADHLNELHDRQVVEEHRRVALLLLGQKQCSKGSKMFLHSPIQLYILHDPILETLFPFRSYSILVLLFHPKDHASFSLSLSVTLTIP